MVIFDSDTNDENNTKLATIEDDKNIQELIIYPNPKYGVFTIMPLNEKSEFIKMTVTDLRGVVVYFNNTFTDEVQLQNPATGIYFITLYFKDKVYISKFAIL